MTHRFPQSATVVAAAVVVTSAAFVPIQACAWGSTGHRIITRVALRALPSRMPAFLTLPETQTIAIDLAPELDRLKGAGESFDADSNPGHYLRLGDDGRIAGILLLASMPATMEAFADKLQTVSTNPWKTGYLPYAIADGWQRLRQDFAYMRVYEYLVARAKGPTRATFALERSLIEKIIIADIGLWGHYVGDASQPLHTSVHYNDDDMNIPFETDFVRAHVSPDAVQKLVPTGAPAQATALISQRDLLAQIGAYITATNRHTAMVYEIGKRGGFSQVTPEALDFTNARLADGARELRDLVVQAYDNSLYAKIGTPAVSVQDVLNGRVVPTQSTLRAN
ncbi:MAG: hypothetical protein JO199_09655 [Candidatus Eremiobacteraeota bacterium]|nr:hypothetical protein [Candidatus Eremiobacteraeota bacterium]